MNFEVIQGLRLACDGFISPKLEQDYIQLTSAERASQLMLDAIDAGRLDDLVELCSDAEAERENQGFVNGFRMGMRLMSECTGAAPLETLKPGTPGNVAPIPFSRPTEADTSKQGMEDSKNVLASAKSGAEDVQALFGSVKAITGAMEDYIRHYIRETPFGKAVTEHMAYHADSLQELLAVADHLIIEIEETQGAVVRMLSEQVRAEKGVA